MSYRYLALDSLIVNRANDRHGELENETAAIGQSTWDDRMKSNFINRTGMGGSLNIADEVEKRLAEAGMLPRKKIPRSNLNRLMSGEAFRNRVGFTSAKGRFEFTHDEPVVLRALRRIADDFASRKRVLGDIWDIDGKRAYLDQLEQEGLLPTAVNSLASKQAIQPSEKPALVARPTRVARPQVRTTLIPNTTYAIAWAGRIQRHRAIWEELQFHLNLRDHPNAISVLFRVLAELATENYIEQTKLATVAQNDSIAKRVLKAAQDLKSQGKIDEKYSELLSKFPQRDHLLSADTLNRYVHSPNFAPSPDHLRAMWDWMANYLVHCLNA